MASPMPTSSNQVALASVEFTEAHVPSKKPAIVLVHGNGCDATAMAPLIQELLAQGYAPQDIYTS